jgi:Leucine-rich repeat (LRR) protein
LYNLQSLSFSPINLVDLSGCKNSTVKELHLYGGGLTNFRSLLGIENMPNLEHISIMNAPGISHISEIFPSAHKIRTLRIKGCAGINMEGLQIYCTVNKIALNKG